MKKTASLFAICILAWSCNNETNNSTETTDSTNKTSVDSGSSMNSGPDSMANKMQTVQADEASSMFLPKAADGGMAEVEHGRLAEQKGTNQAVKDYGAMMVRDHSAANDKVKALATQRNIALPDSMSAKHKKMMDDFNKKSGKDFDKAYINAMVKDHVEDIKEFENTANKTSDIEVKAFINNTLPTLRIHLDSAKAIQKRLK